MRPVGPAVQNNTGESQGGGGLVQRWRGVADGLWDVPSADHEEELCDGQEEEIKENNWAGYHRFRWRRPTTGAYERSALTITLKI